jgi:hypothetical protein
MLVSPSPPANQQAASLFCAACFLLVCHPDHPQGIVILNPRDIVILTTTHIVILDPERSRRGRICFCLCRCLFSFTHPRLPSSRPKQRTALSFVAQWRDPRISLFPCFCFYLHVKPQNYSTPHPSTTYLCPTSSPPSAKMNIDIKTKAPVINRGFPI